ncbi:MAG: hypothetical protein AAFY42_03850 [Pseudomonadota bacterium]
MKVQALSDAEISRRLPLWIALSDTLLDTELSEGRYRQIAHVIAKSGFSPDEALMIFREDVVPAFAINLLSTAGEWTGWPDDYVRERVLEARKSRVSRALLTRIFRRYFEHEWLRICEHL